MTRERATGASTRRRSSRSQTAKGVLAEAERPLAASEDETPDVVAADALQKAKDAALAALSGVVDTADGAEGAESDQATQAVAKRPRGKQPVLGEKDGGDVRGIGASGAVGDAVETDGEAEYVPETVEVPEEFGELEEAMAKFAASGQPAVEDDADGGDEGRDGQDGISREESLTDTGDKDGGGEERVDGGGAEKEKKRAALSERQLRRRKRLSVAQLKALVRDPAVVEQWDVTAADPLLLVHLKALYGSVPVPANWRQKRKYLQSKRGMEKLPFKMPQFIEDTGIGAARTALAEADAAKTAKQKGRERIRPKAAGKGVDIDYSVMRDAFFKFQTKPRLTGHGDLYYELREREVQHERFRPGALSAGLREALGVGPGDPAPWLVAMQRYGPPPSYPGLEVPGLNAPIPAGAAFGYHAGGWGKPPVDAAGRPLYGDVFAEGTEYGAADARFDLPAAEKARLWGEPRPLSEFADDEEDDAAAAAARRRHDYVAEEDAAVEKPAAGAEEEAGRGGAAAADAGGLSGALSVTPGMETPAAGIELRKGLAAGQLYSVLEQRQASVGAGGVMGSAHVYSVGGGEEEAGRATADGGGEGLLTKRKRRESLREAEESERKRAREATEAAKAKEFKF